MKALFDFTNIDKATAIHQLFPSRIPALLEFIDEFSTSILADRENIKWDNNPFISLSHYLAIIEAIQETVRIKGAKLQKSHTFFANTLFEGMLAIYANHCVETYSKRVEQEFPDFKKAVDLFFKTSH